MLAQPDVPPHPFFTPAQAYPVLLRHANGVTNDDAAWDNRGATVRVLHPQHADQCDQPLLDLLLTTGECFPNGTAEEFLGWLRADAKTRERIARRFPHIAQASWESFRTPQSYTELHYYSKVASHFLAETGQWWVRYRLLPPDKREDSGFLDTQGYVLPPERLTRQAGDRRSATFLHDMFRAQVEVQGVDYLLQVQLYPMSASASDNDTILDCARPWPHDRFPFTPSPRPRPPPAARSLRALACRPARRGSPPERLTARRRAVQCDFGWGWTWVSGWGRVAPQGGPGGQAAGRGGRRGTTVRVTVPETVPACGG